MTAASTNFEGMNSPFGKVCWSVISASVFEQRRDSCHLKSGIRPYYLGVRDRPVRNLKTKARPTCTWQSLRCGGGMLRGNSQNSEITHDEEGNRRDKLWLDWANYYVKLVTCCAELSVPLNLSPLLPQMRFLLRVSSLNNSVFSWKQHYSPPRQR